jgi:AcrR family transcriptional regulator
VSAPSTSDRAESKRQKLIDAGLALLDELPYSEITVSMVAERAQMARGLLFYYFGDKDSFFQQVVAALQEQQLAGYEVNDPSEVDDPMTWLAAEVSIFLDTMEAHPRLMRTLAEQGWLDANPSGSRIGDFTTGRIRQAFRLSEDNALLDAALHSWGIHCVDLVVRAQHHDAWDRDAVGALVMAELRAVLATVGDPSPAD